MIAVLFNVGVAFKATPEVYDWMNKFREQTCETTVVEETIPLWSKQAGLIEKLGK